MAKECLKCGNNIPNRIKIEDKEYNLQRRKYCLECSPHGSRNTKKLHLPEGSPEGFLQSKIPAGLRSEDNRKRYNSMAQESQRKKGFNLKKEIVNLKGGCCQMCEYSNNLSALVFHHRDPLEKKFELNVSLLLRKDFRLVLEELEKCDLYCHNCHMAVHRPHLDNWQNKSWEELKLEIGLEYDK